jgi:hypothetical protein
MNYKKIDIKISPKLMLGTVVETSICACKRSVYEQAGEQMQVEINSVRWARWTCFECGKVTDVRIIDVYPEHPFVPIKHTLLDLLDIGAALPIMPKPAGWEKVFDGKVSPKGFVNPRVQILN